MLNTCAFLSVKQMCSFYMLNMFNMIVFNTFGHFSCEAGFNEGP